jgi:hypothetical protein
MLKISLTRGRGADAIVQIVIAALTKY